MRIKSYFYVWALLLVGLCIALCFLPPEKPLLHLYVLTGFILLILCYLLVFYNKIVKPMNTIGNGMELLRDIRDSIIWNMKVVFYTAYDKYMIEAIRESAFDYLLKPFQPQELELILHRFLLQMQGSQRSGLASMPSSIGDTFMVYTPTNDMRVLRASEIGFFRYSSERKLWEVILSNDPPLTLRRGMTADAIIRNLPRCVQIHQSYIINMDYLMLIKDNRCQLYPPFDRVTELVVSKKFKKELQDRFCL